MKRTMHLKFLGSLSLGLGMILFILIPAHSQERVDLDYFNPAFMKELAEVEKYHFSEATFWKQFKSGQYKSALEELKFILRYFPNHPRALHFLGPLGKLMAVPPLAAPYYERALRLYPQYPLSHVQYGTYLMEIGELDDAIKRLDEAVKIDPAFSPGFAKLAEAHAQKGNLETANRAAERARELGYKERIPGLEEKSQ